MAILNFSDVLIKVGLDPKRVKLIRHSLADKDFRECYEKGMVTEYTRVQSDNFSNGYDYWCVFISDKSTTAKFFACYKVNGGACDTQDVKPDNFPLSDQPDLHKLCQRAAYRSGHHRRSVLLWNADSWDSVCRCGLGVCGCYCAGADFRRMDRRRSWHIFDSAGRPRQSSVVRSLSARFTAGGGQPDLSQGGR